MKIAIVDDDPAYGRKLKSLVETTDLPGGLPKCELLTDGDQLLARYEKRQQPYDMILLDLEMPLVGGIEAALEIRGRYDRDVVILVVTAHRQLALSASRFQPFYYLLKPELSVVQFREDFLAAYAACRHKHERTFTIERNGSWQKVKLSSIYYIHRPKNSQAVFVTVHGELRDRRSLNVIQQELTQQGITGFYRVFRSLIVNMAQVIETDRPGRFIRMINGDELPVSSFEIKKFWQAWLEQQE